MGANKLEAFDTQVIHRSALTEADYNPRKISDSAKKKIKKFMKSNGLWSPLIWNQRTGRLVSGHQRLAAMDSLMGTGDYNLTVAAVDVDEKTEVSGNVFMNNQSAMGEWDYDILAQLGDLFPEVDYVADFGFDPEEVAFFTRSATEEIERVSDFNPEAGAKVESQLPPEEAEKFRELKKEAREKAKTDNLDGKGYSFADADYTVTLIFPSAVLKRQFMSMLNQPENEKRILSDVLLAFMEDDNG